MIATKAQLINDAFEQLRISGITAPATPGEQEKALTRMEGMLAEYEGRNICVNYLFEDEPDPSTTSGVEIQFNQMIATNLAVRMIPDFGKGSQNSESILELKQQARQSLSNASARTAKVNRTNYPDRQAIGSGNSFRWNKWRRFYKEKEDAPISCSTEDMQLNTVDSFIVSWANFLGEGETIESYEITVTEGLEVQTSQIQNDETEVFYRIKSTLCGYQIVTISIVTTETTPDNADVKQVNFNVIKNLSSS